MFGLGWGGLLWYCPKRPSEELVECVGEAGAAALCKHYGGENISITNDLIQPPSLKSQIIPLIEQGLSHNEIAMILGCHWRHVAGVKQAMREDGTTPAHRARLRRSKNCGVARLPM
ncbi:MAG: hypothetical protein EOL86_12680 [Deltaproteobacteria bacterium]|nr:hypothetical protein [Deltaproteobacteria bacterium]